MQTPMDDVGILTRYPEPHKVPTNPHWCPYAKGSPREGQATQSSNSVESRGLLHVHPWAPRLPVVSYSLWRMTWAMWVSSIIIWATLTPGLHSRGLDVARRVAPCQRSVHSSLVPIGLTHKCVVGWGGAWVVNAPQFKGFVGYECVAA
jgi:hypothetical protein